MFLKTDGAGNLSFDSLSFSTPLAVIGNATAGSEIRLPEDTDNGSNYVAIKAPDTLASNLTLTLPSADGTSGQVLQTNGSGVLSFASSSAVNTPAFHARMSANQTLSNATATKLVFDTEEFDTNSAYDTSTYRFTVPSGKAGKYFIYSSITGFSLDVPSDLGTVALQIYKNGTSVSYTVTSPLNAGKGYFFSAYQHLTLSLSVGDYIEIYGYIVVTSGTPTITNSGKTYSNSFGGFKIIE